MTVTLRLASGQGRIAGHSDEDEAGIVQRGDQVLAAGKPPSDLLGNDLETSARQRRDARAGVRTAVVEEAPE
jgi:hypothetical protein